MCTPTIVKQLANDSMLNNATIVKEACRNDKGECGISLYGTWLRRGHVSYNGVVSAISLDTKKCLNVQILLENVRNGKRKKTTQNVKSGNAVTTVRSTMLDVPIVYDGSQIKFSQKKQRNN